MMRKTIISAAFALLTFSGMSHPAHALFEGDKLDPTFCDQPTVRSTVIYIDDKMMAEGKLEWGAKLATKLKATLTPGERVSVVRLSPDTGMSKEYWSGCWPDFNPVKKEALRKQTFLIQKNPVDRLGDQQALFFKAVNVALAGIYGESKRPVAEVKVAADNPPHKQLLRALASDEGRFASGTTTIRAIIYSDMAENSDLGSAFGPPPKVGPAYGSQLGSYLRRGVFYAFGVGEDVHGDQGFIERARAFWTGALKSMAAIPAGLNADLNISNVVPLIGYTWPVTLTFSGQELDGKVSILVGDEGRLVDSWIWISRLGSAALNGTFKCSTGDAACRLDAETSSGIATNSPSEAVVMSGTTKAMSGKLGVRGQNTTFVLKSDGPGS
jgi:hypothetical protein